MSEEFIKVATQEINEELSEISSILEACQNDADISKKSSEIEQHMHKIKGLAPMMGQTEIGNLAKILDSILKKIASGEKIDGFFEPLCISVKQMKNSMTGPEDMSEVEKIISEIASKIVD